jgi:hypothetical protein
MPANDVFYLHSRNIFPAAGDNLSFGIHNSFLLYDALMLEHSVDRDTQDNSSDYKGEYKLVGAEFQFNASVSGLWSLVSGCDTPIRPFDLMPHAFRLLTLGPSNP